MLFFPPVHNCYTCFHIPRTTFVVPSFTLNTLHPLDSLWFQNSFLNILRTVLRLSFWLEFFSNSCLFFSLLCLFGNLTWPCQGQVIRRRVQVFVIVSSFLLFSVFCSNFFYEYFSGLLSSFVFFVVLLVSGLPLPKVSVRLCFLACVCLVLTLKPRPSGNGRVRWLNSTRSRCCCGSNRRDFNWRSGSDRLKMIGNYNWV